MALSNPSEIKNVGSNLYYKILKVEKIDKIFEIRLGVFNSKEDAKNSDNILGYGTYSFYPNDLTENLIKQAYEYLKSLNGFKDFIDI